MQKAFILFLLILLSAPHYIMAAETLRPEICEGVESFAIQADRNRRLIVLSNPRNKMISTFRCELLNDDFQTCSALFVETNQEYCSLEANNKARLLRQAGMIRVVGGIATVADGGATLISRTQSANDIRSNARKSIQEQSVSTCDDLQSILRVIRGESWNTVTSNLSEEHSMLLAATNLNLATPVIGTMLSASTALIPRSESNSGFLSTSVMGHANNQRAYRNSIKTSSFENRNFTVTTNPQAANNICTAMTSPSVPSRGSSRDGQNTPATSGRQRATQ